jgi:small-conductance mechanosensitive channel
MERAADQQGAALTQLGQTLAALQTGTRQNADAAAEIAATAETLRTLSQRLQASLTLLSPSQSRATPQAVAAPPPTAPRPEPVAVRDTRPPSPPVSPLAAPKRVSAKPIDERQFVRF